MAGDWIKMRVWLRRDPRVASMADYLAISRAFMDHITDPVQRSCDSTVYEHITSDVTRAITVCALLEVWGVARERGDRDGDDLVLKHCDLSNIDAICSVPGFGEAMEYVEWVSEEEHTDKKGRSVSYVRFPNFFAENESPEDRYKKQHAEAQARYRAKKSTESDKTVDASSDITSDITVTPREEKRREEKNTPLAPKGEPEGFTTFWSEYPGMRKGSKGKCLAVWAKGRCEGEALAILGHIRSLKTSDDWKREGGRFVPAPLVYLNQRRWEGAETHSGGSIGLQLVGAL